MQDPNESRPADTGAVKELWLDCMKAAQKHGTLEKQQTIRATTPQQRDVAKKQNHALTRVVFGMPEGYERIKWNSQSGDDASCQ